VTIDVEAYYRKYWLLVLRRCLRMLPNPADAADAAQDTFVQLLRNKSNLDDHAPSSLLYRMATNVCLNVLRGRSRRGEVFDDAKLLPMTTSEVKRYDSRALLRAVFGQVRSSTVSMAAMHWLHGETLQIVAAKTGLSVSGVRLRLRQLRSRLRELEE